MDEITSFFSEIYRLYDKYKLKALSPMLDDISHPVKK